MTLLPGQGVVCPLTEGKLTKEGEEQMVACEVGRCSFTVSKPVLKAPIVSALETMIS